MREADRIVFLGFAFHRQNMKLLWPDSGGALFHRRVYGTAIEISDSDAGLIKL